ncbi:MAG: hypothetical protein ABFC74_05680 [Rectinema sp.]
MYSWTMLVCNARRCCTHKALLGTRKALLGTRKALLDTRKALLDLRLFRLFR